MADQVRSNQIIAKRSTERDERQPRILDRTGGENHNTPPRQANWPMTGVYGDDLSHALRDAGLQAGHVTIRYDHQPFFDVIAPRFHPCRAGRANDQWHRTEFIKRKKSRSRRPALHREGCLELLDSVCTDGPRRRWELRERHRGCHSAEPIEQQLTKPFVHGAEHEIVCLINTDLLRRLCEVFRLEILDNLPGPDRRRHLGVKQLR